jgi:enoyl-CoA hydratase/carnithine racemase
MSPSTKITLETRGHVLLIGLNRPDKLNAADLEMLQSLSMAYGQLDSDPNLRVGLVHAHGDHFTAGLDLMDIGPKMASGQLNLVPEGGLDPWGIATKQVSKPVVMAIRGTCYTLGVELALVSDIVVAADDAKFAQLEVSRGILPFGGGSFRFPKAAGWSNAMRYLLTGDSFGAQDAHRFNLVTEVVEVGQELDFALELAIKIANQAPLAVQATLASARAGDTAQEKAQLMIRLGKLMQSNDVRRGMEAFMTKQPAKFEGN